MVMQFPNKNSINYSMEQASAPILTIQLLGSVDILDAGMNPCASREKPPQRLG